MIEQTCIEMKAIYAIVTHHERPDDAAEAWKDCNVCAIGWSRFGNLKKTRKENLPSDIRTFLKIKKGDLILAYAGANRIAYVGEIIDGKYMHTTRNIVGKSEDEGGFEYSNQYRVNWWDEPFDFSRYDLPPFLLNQLGKRGRTVTPIELQRRSFEEVKRIIMINARSGYLSFEVNEDMIKASIRKYMKRHINSLEKGLKIVKAEKAVSQTDRPDFIARDSSGQAVIIECKGTAHHEDCEQLERYGKNYAKGNARLILVAFKITDECLLSARKSTGIELFECDLKFRKIL